MTTFSRHGIGLLIVLAFTALAGCGSSGGSEAPTRAAFIKQADAICKTADDEQAKSLEEAAKTHSIEKMSSAEQLELAVELGLPPVQKEAEELGELTPPAGDEGKVEAFVAAIEEGTKKGEAVPSLLANESKAYKEADQLGKAYGFEDCSEPS